MKPWTLDDMKTALSELAALDDDDREQAQLRAHILDVATEQFARFGYRRANVGDIARAAGVSKGAMYLHFDSKMTLLLACIAREKMALMPGMERVLSLPPPEQLEAYVALTLQFVISNPLTKGLMRGDPELNRALQQLPDFQPNRERGIALVEQFIAGGAPDMSAAVRRERAEVLVGVLGLPAYLGTHPAAQIHLPDARFVEVYAGILARGILSMAPA